MVDVTPVADRLTREIPDLMAEHDVPGLAIGICDSSGVLWSEGFGVKRAGGTDRVTPRTMFSIQSVSKMYTATAVMLAVRQGLLDLDEPVTSYLPDFTVNSAWEEHPERRLTLRHLLGHTAGFTHEAPYGSNYTPGRSWTRHCESIADTWLRFPVGHHVEYSNLGVDLAGHILERVSGKPFTTFVRQQLLRPLGLERTTFVPSAIAEETDRATGHVERSGRLPRRVPMIAAGGAYAGVEDACRFLRCHLAGGLGVLGPDHLEEMYRLPFADSGQEEGYGLGVHTMCWDGRLIRGHGGDGYGFACANLWSPADGIGAVILTNAYGHALSWELARTIFSGLRAGGVTATGSTRPVPAATPVTPADRHRLSGTYVGAVSATITFRSSGPVLLRGEEEHRVRLTGPDELLVEDAERERLRACCDDGRGRAKYLVRRRDGFALYRNDVPDIDPDAPADGHWNRTYDITAAAAPLRTVRLLRCNGQAAVELRSSSSRTLGLEEHLPGLYLSSTGEALDLTRSPVTYANIPLRPRR